VDQAITRYPSTGPIYARACGLSVEVLLGLLNAAARAEQFAERTASGPRSEADRSGWRERTPPLGSLGYTGSYQERSREVVDVSVVSVLEARGPE
jgi:hypothetical protein